MAEWEGEARVAVVGGRAQLGMGEMLGSVDPGRLEGVAVSRRGGRDEELVRVEACRDDTVLLVKEVAVREEDEREPCM